MGVFFPKCLAAFKVIFDGFNSPDSAPYVIRVRPKSATIHLNSYKEADTFEMEFDAMDFPFSPEVLRGAGVEIYIYESETAVDETPNALWGGREGLKPQLVGLVDDAHLHLGMDGRTFTVTGVDYTCLMLDKLWHPEHKVPHKTLKQFVEDLVATCAAGSIVSPNGQQSLAPGEVPFSGAAGGRTMLKVVMLAEDTIDFEASQLTLAGVEKIKTKKTRHGLKTKISHGKEPHTKDGSKTRKNGRSIRAGRNYWDVIYQTCVSLGYICYVDGLDVIVAKPHVLDAAAVERTRRVAYGRNLSSLDVQRKLNRVAVPEVVVIGYDSKKRQPVEGRWSRAKDQPIPDSEKKKTVDGMVKEETLWLDGPWGASKEQLTEMAKSYYHTVARGEGKITFATKALRDLDNADLINLKVSDPIFIQWDAFNSEELHKIPEESSRAAFLRSRGYKDVIARLVASQYQKLNLIDRPFYTRNITKSWNKDSGLQLSVEAVNFIFTGRDDAQ